MKDYSTLTCEEILSLNSEDLRALPHDELCAVVWRALSFLSREEAIKILNGLQRKGG